MVMAYRALLDNAMTSSAQKIKSASLQELSTVNVVKVLFQPQIIIALT